MKKVDSSVIAKVSYKAEEDTLDVVFVNESLYRYFGVPKKVYDKFMESDSKGEFFNQNIKDRYSCFKKVK